MSCSFSVRSRVKGIFVAIEEVSGSNDLPVNVGQEDLLGMKLQLDALSGYIVTCQTPMTVAIQGDWGSGKTSTMNLLAPRLDPDKADVLWFNTWQYAQFDSGRDLPLLLITSITSQLARKMAVTPSGQQAEIIAGFRKVGSTLSQIALKVASNKSGIDLAPVFESILRGGQAENSPIEALTHLREEFSDLVKKYLKATEKERLVIFIGSSRTRV